jgi:hypothetical protein
MYEIELDLKKNCLYMKITGFLQEEDAKQMADTIILKAKKLEPGYTIINDISQCKPAPKEAFTHLKRGHSFVARHGVKRIIRVIGNPVTAMQFNRAQRESQTDLEIIEVESLEEAERLLKE